jgi:hypothetical protein
MTHVTTPHTGAHAQSEYDYNPRALFRRLLEECIKECGAPNREVITGAMLVHLEKEPEYWDAILANWITREWENALGKKRRGGKKKTPEQQAAEAEADRLAVAALVVETKLQILSEMVLSNGKMLKDCDENEVCQESSLHTHKGRFLRRVCKAMAGTGKLVGEVLPEQDLQDMHGT